MSEQIKNGDQSTPTMIFGEQRYERGEKRVVTCVNCGESFSYLHRGTGTRRRLYCSQGCRSRHMFAEGRAAEKLGKPAPPIRFGHPRETEEREARWKQRLRERRAKTNPKSG